MTTTAVLDQVGMNPAAVQELETLFRQQIDQGLHPGAGLAVYRQGQLAIDLWGGLADDAAGTPVNADTMFICTPPPSPWPPSASTSLWRAGPARLGRPLAKVLAPVSPTTTRAALPSGTS